MTATKRVKKYMTLQSAVKSLTSGDRLWRMAWSEDPNSDDFHIPLMLDYATGRLMAVRGRDAYITRSNYSMTVADILGRDWEVHRGKP